MVLCKFFQQGSCRFGSKCNNEHFDVKQVIKTDVEGAINGKQWPLSSYGPFKDKPSIPNFIEDRSFEEIRLLCYEAKQKNFFDRFHQQFSKEALEASNKMKALLQMTPDIIDVVINVYDTPADTSCNGVAVAGKPNSTSNNPFGMANAGTSSAGSIFAKPTTQPASNVFGNNTTIGGNFTSSNPGANGIFGGGANASQTSSNIFGNSSSFGQPSQQQQQQQTSIFGQAAKPANSVFGGANTNIQQQQSSMFGQQATQQPAPTMGGNLFAQPAQQQQQPNPGFGLFSQQQQQSSIFAQQPQQQTTNIFGQTQIPQAANPFTQAVQQTPPAQQGLFAQAAQSMQQPQPPQQGLFAQAAQQTMPPQQTSGQGHFSQVAQPTQNIFGQAMQQQPNSTNAFQQTSQNLGQQQQQSQPPTTGQFQQNTLQNQNPAGNNNPSSLVSSTLYSRMEDLSPEEIEAFKADCFLSGKIPFNPPPRELIY